MSWQRARLKDLCVDAGQYGLNISADSYVSAGTRLIRTSDIEPDGSLRDEGVYVDIPLESRHLLRAGDLLLSRSGTLGRSFVTSIAAEGATFAGYLVRFRPRAGVDPRFLGYIASSIPFQDAIRADAVASTIQNFNAERYAKIPVPLPSLDAQRRVADFLDGETLKISALVAKKRKLLSLLEERINSRILEYVGSSSLVNRSDAAIPALPVRRLLSKRVRPAAAVEEVVTAFRDGQVTARSKRRVDGYTVSSDVEAQGQYVEVGDVVIHGLDGFAGAIGASDSAGNCSPVYHVCIPRGQGNSLFFGRLLRVLAVSGYLGLFAISTRERAVDFRNWNLFGRIPIPNVPPQEQEEIGEWISSTVPLRAAVERSFVLAEEHRQALITAAVTEQIDVTTARGIKV